MHATCPEFNPTSYPPYADFSGTIPYSAPEALSPALGTNPITSDALHRMDVYSLGVSLYSLFVSGREPYSTAKSGVEQMLLASKGAFWEWEERQYLASIPSMQPNTPATPPPVEQSSTSGVHSQPPSPVSTVSVVQGSNLSRSLSLGLGPRPRRRRTLRSRKTAPREFRKFLSGDPLPPNVEALLRDMVSPDPHLRPDATEILKRLDSMEPEIFEP
ncbi:hypothetical protein GQ54DRAFT_298438 [Martensiomyces pterosporus]|nr:hypothetical protein GQ54DRAFT_298438 [Martensiomyces pterosporus]